ncbi:RNA 2',3'-cyclic phosphodiesterase [Massilia terrae]|uniref:RNA 2',3'-cyclic phosphodiesterase n=1 Tax=Massilia terrae TaxID=1811224 RepID=A0ABT2D2L5_9BURK|nr:RNA 2',3'-cyclic phosphodiesterase [Massilia terrae]MCS0660466.1 RNA 2',3'-cyclic phosphodiesterase [Massilia terrae]
MDARPASSRLFLALWPEPAVREALRGWRELWSWPRGAAPVAADKLHITLHFLGDHPTARLPELMDGLAVPFTPFQLQLGVPAVWPGGIAVLEPAHQPVELLQLHRHLGQALLDLELTPEARAYKPHVTMARRAAHAGMPAAGAELAWDIDGYCLVESRGGSYTVLTRYS